MVLSQKQSRVVMALNSKPVFWIYLVLVHALLAVLVYWSGVVPRLMTRMTGEMVENTHLYDALLPYHRRMDGSVPEAAIVFLGDSIVQALATSAVADKTVNYGIGADTVGGLHARLPVYKSLEKARAIVISVGVNDLWYRSHDQILPLYNHLLADLPQTIPIVVNGLFPVDERLEFASGTNVRIERVNNSLARLTAGYANVLFIDNRQLFIDSDGQLRSDFHIGDGLHLNTNGYRVWIDILQSTLSGVTALATD